MRPAAVAEAVAHLLWVPPAVPSLTALACRSPADVWRHLRQDPGAVLLVVRALTPGPASSLPDSLPALLHAPEIVELALRLYNESDSPPALPQAVTEACLEYATRARRLAEETGKCDPDLAWTSGLLAPLGWLAVGVVDPEAVSEVLTSPDLARDPEAVQQRRWGLPQDALARRLAMRWRLPGWLAGIVGRLGLPADLASRLGGDANLFRVTQLAVLLAQQQGVGLALTVGSSTDELARELELPSTSLRLVRDDSVEALAAEELSAGPHLRQFLSLLAETRRLEAAQQAADLQAELDVLHQAVREQRGREAERLQTLKLRALAEFAAGAGHEINNPLAVISGQAQWLLNREQEPERRKALEVVIAQTQRIHHLLRDVMQFARPATPRKMAVDLVRLADEVVASLQELADARKVRLTARPPAEGTPAAITVEADPLQLRSALANIVRNAVEAAGEDGWAVVRLEVLPRERADIIVEDSGPELSPAAREHLFDPFWSGRTAGRGKGLGLPTAWSLTRQQGGDVFLASQAGEPTRFILRLPLPREQTDALAG